LANYSHHEDNSIPVGGLSSEKNPAKVVARKTTVTGVLVLWETTLPGEPKYVLDSETQSQAGGFDYERLPEFLNGFNSAKKALLWLEQQEAPMRYWWVNQRKTYRYRAPYMWSPKKNRKGGTNPYYDFMENVSIGDVVFAYANGEIKGIGIASGLAVTHEIPDEFKTAKDSWAVDGWLVPVEFSELSKPLRPKIHIKKLKPLLPDKYSPLRDTGDGREFYLTEVPASLAMALIGLCGEQASSVVDAGLTNISPSALDRQAQLELLDRKDIGDRVKRQMVDARRGQGLFREKVAAREPSCRVTGVAELRHLRASHIKPWRKSNDHEKLDGDNGLLLSPHIDHLFDRGFISFSKNGTILVSDKLDVDVLDSWQIDPSVNVGSFTDKQDIYLEYHRKEIFKVY
jgi:putative restriction endonuclease